MAQSAKHAVPRNPSAKGGNGPSSPPQNDAMLETPRKYEASIFGNMQDIRPSADTISALLDAFRDRELLPSTFHEFGPSFPGPMPRIRLARPDNEWIIDFDTTRIMIQKNMTKPNGANMGTLEGFGREVVDLAERILRRFPKRGTRLSLVTESIMRQVDDAALRRIYGKHFHHIPFYVDNCPVEWNSRSVARTFMKLSGSDELLNVITDIKRVTGEVLTQDRIQPLDRILVAFDINTFQGNADTRFDSASIVEFYPKALQLRAMLLSQVRELIDE